MSEKEMREFLSKPIIARISTVGEDGSPYIAPMWYVYEDGAVIMSTGVDAAKVKNIRENPAVAVSIDTSDGGFKSRGVIFRGNAELVEKDTLETTTRIYKKYLGDLDHPMAKYLLGLPRAVIIIRPEKTTSWDYAKMGG